MVGILAYRRLFHQWHYQRYFASKLLFAAYIPTNVHLVTFMDPSRIGILSDMHTGWFVLRSKAVIIPLYSLQSSCKSITMTRLLSGPCLWL